MLTPFRADTSESAVVANPMQHVFERAVNNTRSGLYIEAFRDWVDYLEWAEKNPTAAGPDNLQSAYIALATIHFNFQDYESALDFNQRGYSIACEKGDGASSIHFLNNMVGCYSEMGRFDDATRCNDRMREIASELGTASKFDYNYQFNLGYIAKKQHRFSQAATHYKSALYHLDAAGMDSARRAYPYSELFSVYEQSQQLDSALHYLLLYQSHANKPYLQKDCYRELMRLYARIGDNRRCLESQQAYFYLTDSVLNEREFIEIRNQYLSREKEEREGQISDLYVSLSRRTIVLVITGVALLFIGVVTILIWRQKQRLNVAYTDLYRRNRELLRIHTELKEERKRQRAAGIPTADIHPSTPADPDQPDPSELSDGSELSESSEPSDISENSEPSSPSDEATPDAVNEQLLAKIIDIFDSTDLYLNPDFSLALLAKAVGSNTKYVSQAINYSLGCNFRSLVNEYRIKEAQRRMLDTSSFGHLTIQGIAESVGYKSPSNFITAFRRSTGIMPSLFMKMAREQQA